MATIQPFRAFRPVKSLAAQIASRPYDVMNRAEAKAMAADNEFSFLHIIRSEIDLPDEVSPYDTQVYEQAKTNFQQMCEEGIFRQDRTPCFYIYAQTANGKTQTGLVCTNSIDDYLNDVIKKHEFTRPAKEQDRINHITTTRLQTGPILMAYPQVPEIDAIIHRITQHPCTYHFDSGDDVTHRFWVVQESGTILNLMYLFHHKVPAIYIADGHHRTASSTKVGLRLRAENSDSHGTESYNYFLSVLFPDNQLTIFDYNRVVKDLGGLTVDDFFQQISQHFAITPQETAFKPSKSGDFGLYIERKWYCLTAKTHTQSTDAIDSLDISVLSNYLLDPILGIKDQRKDARIDFVGGIRGMAGLVERVDSGEMKLAFSIYPVSIKQLIAVADSGRVMPPKSTWFEPKLRSGLVVHQI